MLGWLYFGILVASLAVGLFLVLAINSSSGERVVGGALALVALTHGGFTFLWFASTPDAPPYRPPYPVWTAWAVAGACGALLLGVFAFKAFRLLRRR